MMKKYALILALCSGLAWASGGGGPAPQAAPAPKNNTQQQLQDVERLVKAQQWPQAEALLIDLRRNAADSADVWNWSGFVARKSGRLPDAFGYYDKALKINPKHLGAHEYLGEAYLQNGELAKAQAQLDILQQLCGRCEEAEDLAAEVKKASGTGL
jgi:tetratricopeptide (TPR) repeat protein